MNLIERLRAQAGSLRRKPTPLADLIPLLQEAALELEHKDIYIAKLERALDIKPNPFAAKQ
jgi:hypothetical protein